MAHEMTMKVTGIAKDTHEKFPIRYDVSENGNSFFIGCTIEASIETGSGNTITKRMNVRAFSNVADELAHIQDGDEISVEGSYDMQKSQRDNKYYPILTITKVVSA